jgi:hypothetical protein
MTEAEWLANTSSKRMLRFLKWSPKHRKSLLFAVACCRRLGDLLVDPRSRSVLGVLEAFADRNVSSREVKVARKAAHAAATDVDRPRVAMDRLHYGRAAESETPEFRERYRIVGQQHHGAFAVAAALDCHNSDGTDYTETPVHVAMRCQNALGVAGDEEDAFGVDAGRRGESVYQAALLRDIFGNPFRPVAIDRAWLTTDVLALARGCYDDRAFDRMPILADALQDAGCDHEELLVHCRDTNHVHVRGCWVVDLLLGKG